MSQKIILAIVLCCLCLCGCKKDSPSGHAGGPVFDNSSAAIPAAEAQAKEPVRDSTPDVLVPAADGTTSYGSDTVTIDASHTDQGYVMVRYTGNNQKVKLQIETPKGDTYTYLLSQNHEYETFPLCAGNGNYSLTVLENVEGDMYSIAFAQDIDAVIDDEFLPFLYPNQYVFFTAGSDAVSLGEELAEGMHSDLEAVESIYHYVTSHITYDTEKATSVSYGYLPDVDETLSTGKGICFDYAAVTAAMLRSQKIPTRLEIGYAGEAYHAWISVYVEETGWIDNIIEFDGSSWSLMDPTFAASTNNRDLKKFIGDGSNYVVKYYY
ncbi:MAG: transglutaminase domain-containing protein [Lachnospiraceae bacterium]|nr:transglutaminase domain-containing protein [Lachnospiraceae bacterium]